MDSHIYIKKLLNQTWCIFELENNNYIYRAKVLWFNKSFMLLMAFENDHLDVSHFYAHMLLTSFCMPCAKLWDALREKLRRLRKISIEEKIKIKIMELVALYKNGNLPYSVNFIYRHTLHKQHWYSRNPAFPI